MDYTTLAISLISMLTLLKASPNKFLSPKLHKWQSSQPREIVFDVVADSRRLQFLPATAATIKRRFGRNAANERSAEDYPWLESSTPDYDGAYERFVQRYFATARSAALDVDTEETESNEMDSLSDSNSKELSEELHFAATTMPKSRQKCKKVRKNHQECIVCKNSKNNETSENCSYSRETKPKSFAYSKQVKYRKRHDNDDDESDEKEQHHNKKSQKPIRTKNNKNKERKAMSRGPGIQQGTSSCFRKLEKQKICYYCNNPDGEQLTKCYSPSDEDDVDERRSKSVKNHNLRLSKT